MGRGGVDGTRRERHVARQWTDRDPRCRLPARAQPVRDHRWPRGCRRGGDPAHHRGRPLGRGRRPARVRERAREFRRSDIGRRSAWRRPRARGGADPFSGPPGSGPPACHRPIRSRGGRGDGAAARAECRGRTHRRRLGGGRLDGQRPVHGDRHLPDRPARVRCRHRGHAGCRPPDARGPRSGSDPRNRGQH